MMAKWITKQDPHTCCLQETHFRSKGTQRLKVKRWRKIFSENIYQKKTGNNTYTRRKQTLKQKLYNKR